MSEEALVLVERDGNVGVVRLNRPKQLNALSGDCESYIRDPKLPPNVLSIRLEMPRPRGTGESRP